MDVDAELAAVRSRARRLADKRVNEMRLRLRTAGISDRLIIRDADGLPEPVHPFDALIGAFKTFARSLSGGSKRDYTRAR